METNSLIPILIFQLYFPTVCFKALNLKVFKQIVTFFSKVLKKTNEKHDKITLINIIQYWILLAYGPGSKVYTFIYTEPFLFRTSSWPFRIWSSFYYLFK